MKLKIASAAFLLAAIGASAPVAASEIQDAARDYVKENLAAALAAPEVAAAIKAQNQKNAGLSQADVDALDQRWRAGDAGIIEATLSNELSQYLAEVVQANGGVVTELFVMDSKGLNVGQSDRTSDYWQGDEAKWRETYLVGPDAIHISDVEEDESTQTFQVQVSVSISEGGAAIGAATIGIDVGALESL